ncbi:MAG: HPr family phosphocarrier protein [Streptosporangiales bacterium]|nr:HPr family phosphocarrier protein [Streptosporangiales bacterium]
MPASSDVTLKADLHARPAGQLAVAAAGFQAAVRLSAGGRDADAKSVLGVMQLGASAGATVTVRADGPDEAAAVDALTVILAAVTPAG